MKRKISSKEYWEGSSFYNYTCVSVTRVFLIFFHQQPETTFEQCSFDFRIPRTHDVDGNFLLRSLHVLTLRICSMTLVSFLCLTHWLPCQPWRASAFLPLLTSSLLTKIGVIYTQLLQEEKIFLMTPRSEGWVIWSLRYAQKCSKSSVQLAAPW